MTWFLVQGFEFGAGLPPQIGGGPAQPPVYPSTGPIYGGGHPGNALPWAPGHPGNALPWAPGHPGNALPWAPGRPDHGPPPGVDPKTSMYAGVPESSIPEHPDAPDPAHGEWVLVALGNGSMQWAWMNASGEAAPK